jgi:hypothetical protein
VSGGNLDFRQAGIPRYTLHFSVPLFASSGGSFVDPQVIK